MFFCLIIGQHSLQISAKKVENSPETNSKFALYSLKFSFGDTKEKILWGVLPFHRDASTLKWNEKNITRGLKTTETCEFALNYRFLCFLHFYNYIWLII